MSRDEEPLLSAVEAAKLLGYERASSWRTLASRLRVQPDHYVDDRSPRWRRSTVVSAGAQRKRPGRR